MLQKKRNILPYQETEAFKSLLKEYKEKAIPEEKLIPDEFSQKSLSQEELPSDSTSDTFYIFKKTYMPNESSDDENDKLMN